MESLAEFGLVLMICSFGGLVLGGICYLAEKLGWSDKLMNMFNDHSDDEE